MATYADEEALHTRRDRALFLHRFLFRAAASAGNVFAWIIIFRVFFIQSSLEASLAGVAVLYAFSHSITFFMTPLTGIALRRGVRRALFYGTLAGALSFLIFAALFFSSAMFRSDMFWMIALFVVLNGIYRATYWIPYKTAEADGIARSPFLFAREAVVALMPALSGYLMSTVHGGAFYVFSGIVLTMLVSALLLFRIPESHEPFAWTYGDTIRELFASRNSLAVGLYILDGFQGAALLLVWPLAVFLVLGQSFQALGAILSITLCMAFLGRKLIRRFLHRIGRPDSAPIIATIVFTSWLLRITAGSALHVLAIDVFYHSGTSSRRFSIDSIAHEQSADGGHYVDEYTAIKEMGLTIGRVLLCVLFVILVLVTAEAIAFAASLLVAAVASAWSVFLAHRLEKQTY